MKRWLWKTDDGIWKPIIVCPYCSTAWNPIVIYWFTKCPFCRKRVRMPKKDYWEIKKEGEEK